ncbi:hypothetical protein [Rhizobium sp. BK176]|uniref:hypothetical protein n=1 Tax=Rhizobium sp. BK176 TaxID=2587071 RepID=UPI0021672193|nr:hypothetical protein [Rhizobium sp. BK176]MCS4088429.1 hypothetical protein [Rhizobium sp. BK176]
MTTEAKNPENVALPRIGVALDRSRFPQRTADFRSVSLVPVLFSPIMGSPERFVVGCLCSDRDSIHLERANKLDRLTCLFGEQSKGAVAAIEIALDALSGSIHTDDFLIDTYRSPVSNCRLGETENREGRSLQEAGIFWMSAMSSLYAPQTVEA